MAAIGLLPAAMSNGIGSEASKPLAIVVIGGLITNTTFNLFIFPIIFYWAYRKAGGAREISAGYIKETNTPRVSSIVEGGAASTAPARYN